MNDVFFVYFGMQVGPNETLKMLFFRTLQQTRGVKPMLIQCWSTVYDAGPTLKQPSLSTSVCWENGKFENVVHK